MKPIKLTMKAFGPFNDECVIDFEELYSDGVYLITGDTGSGKTTIFDAISYALYGSASGDKRDERMLRSKYADDRTKTYVKLEFLHNGKIYTVERTPSYTLPTRKTPVANTALLTLPDGETVDGTKDVTEKITDIIKINRDQFRQTSMLAQGDFQKLLFAKTQERQEIFRKIFSTQNYEKLQERINLRFRELKNENEALESRMFIYLSAVKTEDGTSFSEAVGRDYDERLFEMLSVIICKDEQSLRELNNELKETEKLMEETSVLLKNAEENDLIRKKILSAEEALLILQEKFEQTKSRYGLIPGLKDKLSAIEKHYAVEEKELEKYDELETLLKDLDDIKKTLVQREKAVESNLQIISSLEKQAESFSGEYEKLKDLPVRNADLSAYLKDLTAKKDNLEKITERIREYASYVSAISKLHGEAKELSEKYNLLSEKYISAHAHFLGSQAGLLAKDLKEGKPCPVCGSTHHPSPAKHDEQILSGEELEALENEMRALGENYQDKKRNFETKSALANNLLNEIKEQSREISSGDIRQINSSVTEKLRDIYGEISGISAELSRIAKDIKRKEQLEKEIPKINEDITKAHSTINELKLYIAQLSARSAMAESNISRMNETLKYENKKDALSELENLKTLKLSVEKEIVKIEKEYTQTEKDMIEIKAQIKSDTEKIKPVSEDIPSITGKREELDIKKKEISSHISTIQIRISANNDAKTGLESTYKKLSAVRKEYADYAALDEVFSGKITQKDKIELETYIQMRYFDRVLQKANTRFLIMSSSRYELRRKITASSKRSSSGLDLEVVDHYNGTSRDIATLSGGELFLAALSLALGLSDEVQESAGNVLIDALFVDEGFGSLDGQTLSQVMRVINSLSSPQRPVAIISHVEELKNIIDRKIIVSKSVSGSSIRTE